MHKNQKYIFHSRWYKPIFSYAPLRPTPPLLAGRGAAAQRLASALALSSLFCQNPSPIPYPLNLP
jgi:hypothetical protein